MWFLLRIKIKVIAEYINAYYSEYDLVAQFIPRIYCANQVTPIQRPYIPSISFAVQIIIELSGIRVGGWSFEGNPLRKNLFPFYRNK